jgi:hypothetical protein
MVGYTRLLCLSICFNHQHARSARSSNNFKHSSSSYIIFFFPSFSFSLSLLEHVRTNTQVAPLSILKKNKLEIFFLFKRENKFFSEKNYSNRLWWFIPNYIESELEKRQLAAIFPPSRWNVFHTLFGSFWDDYSLSLSLLCRSLSRPNRLGGTSISPCWTAQILLLLWCSVCVESQGLRRESERREREDELCRSRIVFIFRLIRIKCVEIYRR